MRNIYSEIVELMGGDPRSEITRTECLQQLTELSDREFLCGAYWMAKLMFPTESSLLNELGIAENRANMEQILDHFGFPRVLSGANKQ